MKHLPEHFRPPEMHARQDAEHNAADNDVVEMRYDKIRIVELIICRCGRQHDTRDSSEYERGNKGDGIQHRRREFDVSSPDGQKPVENFNAGRHRDRHRRNRKYRISDRSESRCKHVVNPYHEPEKADQHDRKDHRRITEQTFPRKYGNDF